MSKRKLEEAGHDVSDLKYNVCQCGFCQEELSKGRSVEETDGFYRCECGVMKDVFALTIKNKDNVFTTFTCLSCFAEEYKSYDAFGAKRFKFTVTCDHSYNYATVSGHTNPSRLLLRVRGALEAARGRSMDTCIEDLLLAAPTSQNEKGEILIKGKPHYAATAADA